ncbi:MAG: acetate--CoA ligase family protein [Desulfarculus sp.]|nr:acetate--CoA ligase family protein [Pseudomonadota bacterium]MBV1716345.1 acetate--CoA ligase family protein [Desulfarculus sp.]MBU4573724.1 acetate--CoA ligase family protein [Pseudomonadota bacterium]MBU4598494.1 acetate--CoA ligase family protein [Pseudomonadota bacterium]MBV1736829.1 acetate--CoA ligase family protein [Desulfarculus sp.]
MGIFNLDRILTPRSVAVVGASEREGSVGRSVLENIRKGGFTGGVYPINPKRDEVLGLKAFASISQAPCPLDLAVIIVPLKFAPAIVRECGDCGVGGAIIISGGGKETGEEGAALEREILAAAKIAGVRIVGPNCVGIISSPAALNASFIHEMPKPGSLAFVSQSGATCTAVLDLAVTQDIGFSHFISMGSMLDVDFGDIIDYLGNDPGTSAILLYVESITNHRKFISAARAVSRVKPIILLKVGRSAAGAKAAMSHTGAMAGEDAIYDEAFKRAGLVRVNTVGDLFDCAELISKQPLPKGPALAIVTNAGGPGVMATDHMALHGGSEPPQPSRETIAKLDAILPPFWSHANPIDILGDATPETFLKVTQVCVDAHEFDAVLVLTTPQAQFPSTQKAKLLSEELARADFPVFTSWLGGREVMESREIFYKAGIPTYETPERAVQAFLYMYQYHKNLLTLQETPSSLPREIHYDRDQAAALIASVLIEGRSLMSEGESKKLLDLYGIPVTPVHRAASAEEAAACALLTGFPVVLKMDSPDITHKSDAGGVRLSLKSEGQVKEAFEEIMANAKAYDPQARVRGVTVQPMVAVKGVECILGAKKDLEFGPVILFGMGGTMAEIIGDRAIGLPPLNRLLAKRLIDQTKVSKVLRGYRNIPPVDMVMLEEVLVRLSQLLIDFPEIAELDINPLLSHSRGALALDARVVVEPTPQKSPQHLCIRPYPAQYESHERTGGGVDVFLRPIKPEDGPAMIRLFHALSPVTIFQRFGRVLRSMPQELLSRHTQIDYDREMALVVFPEGSEDIAAVGRIIERPGVDEADLGMTVADAWQGRGLGELLFNRLLEIARERKMVRVSGIISPDNRSMLNMVRKYPADLNEMEDGNFKAVLNL